MSANPTLSVAIPVTAVMAGVLRIVPIMDAPVYDRDYPGVIAGASCLVPIG